MALTGTPLKRFDMKADAERRRMERLRTPDRDPNVFKAAQALIESGTVPEETYDSTYGHAISDAANTSPQARRRDAQALGSSSEGWTAQAVHLARAYDHALGWALAYGIQVYSVGDHGVYLRGLGELREAIRAAEAPIIEAQRQIAYAAYLDTQMETLLAQIHSPY